MWEWLRNNWPNAELPWYAFVVLFAFGLLIGVPISKFFNRISLFGERLNNGLLRMESRDLLPIPKDFTRTLAQRVFSCRAREGETIFRVEIGEPSQGADVDSGKDWRCPLRVTLGSQDKVVSVSGVDSLQALQLALAHARVEIEAVARQPGTTLIFLDQIVDTSNPDWSLNLF